MGLIGKDRFARLELTCIHHKLSNIFTVPLEAETSFSNQR